MDDKEFRYLVERMRAAQDGYFETRKDPRATPSALHDALVAAKQLERQVDNAIAAFDQAEHAPLEQQTAMDFDL